MNVKNTITNTIRKIKGFFPTPVPQGLTEFNVWAASIIKTYNPPMDERSVIFTLSTLLMRLGPTEAYKPKRYFARSLHRGAAAQVGAYVMEDIKSKQREEQEAAQRAAAEQLTQEATTTEVASDAQSVQH